MPNLARRLLRDFAETDETDSYMSEPLDSRQLRAFVTLANTGSFTRTGKDLFLTQSAISHAIKALEEDVGCRLFDRVGKSVALTPAGEQLLHYAKKILEEMARARASMERLGKWGRSHLRIAMSEAVCEALLPNVLAQHKEQFPQCQVTVASADMSEAVDLLHNGLADLVLSLEPGLETGLEFVPLFTDELQFLVSAKHPWAVAHQIGREEIPTQPYILYNRSSLTSRLVEGYFRHEDMTLLTMMEVGSMSAIREMVGRGLGVAILAPWVARDEIAAGALVALPLGRRKLLRNWGMLHRRGRRLNLAEEQFISACRREGAKLVGSSKVA
ncbi:MAG: LysR family transcriptional regulator [Verrucomicrobia bacterium]|nr:LysR family transcriptional regulator [Verrucomicrobiota bacterium]